MRSRWALPLMVATVAAASFPALAADEAPPAPPAPPRPADGRPADDLDVRILGWVADLGSEEFGKREEASRRLAEAGPRARAALEQALKTSDSLEVRWRAQQLLLRLSGQVEQPLGRPGEEAPEEQPAPAPGPRRRGPAAVRPEGFDEMARRMQRWLQEMERTFGQPMPGLPFGPHGLPGLTLGGEAFTQGALTLTVPLLPGAPWRLEVRAKAGAAQAPRVLTGEDLEAIVKAHPELEQHPDLPQLRRSLQERGPGGLGAGGFVFPGGPGSTFQLRSSEGLEVRQDASGATVRWQETDAEGRTVWREAKGATLDDVKREHPELQKRLEGLGGFGLRLRGPVIIRRPQDGGLSPMDEPEAEDAPAPRPGVPFGVGLMPVDEVLAHHLGLEAGRGQLVGSVEPGSQAQALGLERFDVLVAIDGQPVTGFEMAFQALRAAARAKAPLSLEIVRQGQRRTLSR